MESKNQIAVTEVFAAADQTSLNRLLERHYQEFRGLARRILNGDAARLNLQPTDLAHEAAIRVMGYDRLTPRDRTHFLAISARVMRQTLIDEVRRHRAAKRSAPPLTTQWLLKDGAAAPAILDLEALDEALHRLEAIDPGLARLVEQRFFAGLTIAEIAIETATSERTVKRHWQMARAWLITALELD